MLSKVRPFSFFIIIVAVVVLAELVAMIVVGYLFHGGDLSIHHDAWVDAILLGLIISPALYYFQYRPTEKAIRALAKKNDELALSSQLYQSTFQYAGAGIVHVDMEGRFLRVNPQFCAITGYEEATLLGMRFIEITHPDDRERDLSAIAELRDGKIDSFTLEKRYLRKRGEAIWANVTATLMRGDDGEPMFYVAVVDDIAERKNREFETLKTQLEAEQANRTKDEFLSLVAHDLKSPLFSMTELLKIVHNEQRKTFSVKNNELMGHAIKTGEQMVVAIKKLLDLTRLQRGTLQLNMEQASLHEIVGYSLGKAAFEAETKKVKLLNEVADDVRLKIDADLLLEIVYNLVSNAIKFSHKGNAVRVVFAPGDCCLMIEDQGVGIPPDLLSDLFEVKKKTIGKGTAGEKGFGIGLPFCRKGMEMMGGTIRVESEVGRGTRFYLRLPGLNDDSTPADDQT